MQSAHPEPVSGRHDASGANRGGGDHRQVRAAGRNLTAAIISGVLLAIAFFASITLNAYVFLTFVAVILVIGLLELDTAVRRSGLRPATPVALLAGLVMFYGTYMAGNVALVVGCGVLTLGTLLWVLLDRRRRFVTQSIASTLFMTLWLPFLASFIGLLLVRPDGRWYVMTTVAYTVSSDIGAYAFGSAFGRHKLAVSISPGKTWEGFIGGVATVLVIAAFVTPVVVSALDTWQALILGGAIAVAATVGDLVESMVKRDLGVKDLGRIVPGHGGIMDRIDGLLFAIPAAHLVLLALGL